RLACRNRSRRPRPRCRNRNGAGRSRADPAKGLHGGRPRPEPRDARDRARAAAARRAHRGERRESALCGRVLRRAHVHLPAALRRRPGGDARRTRARRPSRRNDRRPRVRRSARDLAAALARLRRPGAPSRRSRDRPGLARGRELPRRQHPRVLAKLPARAPARALARRGRRALELPPPQLRRRDRDLGALLTRTRSVPAARPAFYALAPGGWRDYVTLLHLPYTLWHLSYVVIGGCLAANPDGGRLALTVLAFFLGLGIAAHALDELNGRPLQTRIPTGMLVTLAVVSLAGACAIGV